MQFLKNFKKKNSYYYHRQENKLSGTETDSRFFLLEGGSPRARKLPRVSRGARKHFPPMIDMVFF